MKLTQAEIDKNFALLKKANDIVRRDYPEISIYTVEFRDKRSEILKELKNN